MAHSDLTQRGSMRSMQVLNISMDYHFLSRPAVCDSEVSHGRQLAAAIENPYCGCKADSRGRLSH